MLNTRGPKFLEKVYENALTHELRQAGLAIARQKGITVYHSGIPVGGTIAAVVVEETVVVALKASKARWGA